MTATPVCDRGWCSLSCTLGDDRACAQGQCIRWSSGGICAYSAASPTPAPIHPCDDGSHGCDRNGGACVRGIGSSWTCQCSQGFTCTGECSLAGGYRNEVSTSSINQDQTQETISSANDPFAMTALPSTQEVEMGKFDAIMCRPQAEAIYGKERADLMEQDRVFERSGCSDDTTSGSIAAACEFGVCHWGEERVPYYVNGRADLAAIADLSVRELESRTNARFTKLTSPTGSYINVVNSNQCGGVSVLGKAFRGGAQNLEAPTAGNCGGSTATAVSVTVHEFMHALGLFHEQTRPDRDNYITVNWQNIQNGRSNFNYEKRGQQKVDALKLPYDYQSIMHYGDDTFSNGNGPTMTAKGGQRMGSKELSELDKTKINGLYPRQRHTCTAN